MHRNCRIGASNAALAACVCLAIAILVASGLGSARATEPQTVAHKFVYVSRAKLASVNLAGTFNKWSTTATPMTSDAAHKIWTITMRLAPGKYEYKFVLNGKTWQADPKAKSEGSYGNSVVVIAAG